jgi:hypothetical protein
MTRIAPTLLILALVACRAEESSQGTAVGNPIGMVPRAAESATLRLSQASAPFDLIELRPCAGEPVHEPVRSTIDLLANAPLSLPAGRWCGLKLYLSGPVQMTAVGTDGVSALSATLTVPSIYFNADSAFGEAPTYVMELGAPNWWDPYESLLQSGETVALASDAAAAVALAAVLAQDSSVFEDQDANGEVSAAERDKGASAEGDDDDDDDDDDDSHDSDDDTDHPASRTDTGESGD